MFKNMLDRVSPKQDLLKIVDIKDTNKYDKNFFEIIEITEHNCLLINKTRFPLHLMPNEELFSEKLGCISEEMTIDGSIPVHLTFNTRSFFNILKNAEKEKGIDCPFNKIVLPNDNCSELMNGIVEFPGKNHYSNNSFEINIKRCDYLMKILSNLKRRTGENNKLSIIEEMLKLTLFIDQQSYSQYTNKNHNILEKFKTINQEVLTIYKELTKKTKEFSELSIYKFEKQLLKFTSTEEMNKLTNDKIDNIFNIIVPEAFKKITVYNQNIQNSSVKTKEKIKTDISSQNFRYYQKKEDLKVSPDLTNKLNLVPTKTQNFKKPSSQPPPSKHLSFTQRENLRKQQRQRSGSAPAKFRS